MKYKRILILNGTVGRNEHEMIDSSLIIAFSNLSSNLLVGLQPSRKENIQKLISDRIIGCKVSFLSLPNFTKSVRITFRELVAAIWETLLFVIFSGKNTLTCLTYINRFNGYSLNFLSRLLNRPLLIVCHGEIRTISMPYNQNDINWVKMLRHFYVKTNIAPKTKLVVLGENILKNIREFLSSKKYSKFYSFDHPYYPTSETTLSNLHTPIRIGVIGTLRRDPERGFENVKSFARSFDGDTRFELRILSTIIPELREEVPASVVIMNPNSDFLPREEYNRMIDDLDYIYCPYPDDAFKMTASGAILEAIVKRKPILMHSNNYSIYLRQKFGEFGLLIDNISIEEVKNRIMDLSTYEILIKQQEEVIRKIAPENLKDELESLF